MKAVLYACTFENELIRAGLKYSRWNSYKFFALLDDILVKTNSSAVYIFISLSFISKNFFIDIGNECNSTNCNSTSKV